MKRIISLILILAIVLSLAGCGAPKQEDVTITLPASLETEDNPALNSFDLEGIQSADKNDDGSVTYTMDAQTYEVLKQRCHEGIQQAADSMTSSGQYPSLKSFQFSDDMKAITCFVDQDSFSSSFDWLGILVVQMSAAVYQTVIGAQQEELSISTTVIDQESGKVISSTTYPDSSPSEAVAQADSETSSDDKQEAAAAPDDKPQETETADPAEQFNAPKLYMKDGTVVSIGQDVQELVAKYGEPSSDEDGLYIWAVNPNTIMGVQVEDGICTSLFLQDNGVSHSYQGVACGMSASEVRNIWGNAVFTDNSLDEGYGLTVFFDSLGRVSEDKIPNAGTYISVLISTDDTVEYISVESFMDGALFTAAEAQPPYADSAPQPSAPLDPVQLTAGEWIVGEDLPAGRYTVTTDADYCTFLVYPDDWARHNTYQSLSKKDSGYTCRVEDGDRIECSDPILLTPYQ